MAGYYVYCISLFCMYSSDVNKDLGLKAKDFDPKAKDLGPKAKDFDPKSKANAKDLGPKAKDSRCQGQMFQSLFT